MTRIVAGAAALVLCGPAMADEKADRPGGAFNLRLVSDCVPDFSSQEAFVRSALSNWPTDQEKVLAQFRWVHRCRRVGSPMQEDGRPVLDPILFFNSYGVTFCSTISLMNVSLWEAAGWLGRATSLNGHCVSEVRYNDRWHMLDSDFCNYFLDQTGEIASAEALFKGRKRAEGQWYLYDHCPTASGVGGRILMGPSSAALTEVADDWYKRYAPREGAQGAQAGQRYILGLRPGETYTRYWRPLGTGTPYGRPYRDGREAGETLVLMNGRSNGLWTWAPDLGDPTTFFASDNVAFADGALRAKDPKKPAFAVFRVMAANVVTSANIRMVGAVPFEVSANGGQTWEPVPITAVGNDTSIGALDPTVVGGRLEYLLRADLSRGAALSGFHVTTTTQVNQRTLPALRLGTNRIVALSDEHLETITLSPRLASVDFARDCERVSGFERARFTHDWHPSLKADSAAELVLKTTTPRDIKRLRMTSTVLLYDSGSRLAMSASFDGGKTWKAVGEFGRVEPYADRRVAAETRDVPPGSREVLLRWACNGGRTGLLTLFAEVGFEPAGGFMPYRIAYYWYEWHPGPGRARWESHGHVEPVDKPRHEFEIRVGGSRPPRMDQIYLYSDKRRDPQFVENREVDGLARPDYALTYGKVLSVGCPYTVSRPASEAFPDTGGKVLTDGYVSLASYWGLGGINLTGEKNVKRVGELVVWEAGEPVVVTVDFGKVQTVGGARICAVQPNKGILFPETMIVETSTDGKTFAPAGKAHWEDCFFPPADELPWEGADSPLYADLPAGGILDHKFAVCFAKPVEARYVRFTLAPPTDRAAGIGLWELEVYDRLQERPWTDRLRLPD